MPLHERKMQTAAFVCQGMLLVICCIYIKHVRYSQELHEIIKELSLISPKALC